MLRGSWQTYDLLLVNLLILIWYDVEIYFKPQILKPIGSFYGRKPRIQIADPQWWVWRGFGSTWLWCPEPFYVSKRVSCGVSTSILKLWILGRNGQSLREFLEQNYIHSKNCDNGILQQIAYHVTGNVVLWACGMES